MGTLEDDLRAQGMELRQTHISSVFIADGSVYKVRRPVCLGFLDFTTLAARKEDCEAEVTLNRRLAPDVYVGVVPITRDGEGIHRLGAGGDVVEWAVQMRRLADRDAADARLRDGRLERSQIQQLARRLCEFHASARCDEHTARFGSVDAIAANVRENFEQTRHSATRVLEPRHIAAIERWQLAFLSEKRARLEARVAGGRIRDGHGDLRLEHCYFDDTGAVSIIDCIEFNERFRYADVAADIAFLGMDLTWHERADLGEALLAEYARHGGDYDLYGVVDFYESYRAYVRGKVSSFIESDPSLAPEVRDRAAAQARKYYLLAEASTREPLSVPRLYAVGGVIASGKSTLADALSERLSAPVIDADRTRKQLAGVDPHTPWRDAAFGGHYDERGTAAVYAELLRRAQVVLESGRSVILDASFRAAAHRRDAMQLAERCGVQFQFIECRADPALCKRRLAEREKGRSVTDGRAAIFDEFVARYEAVRELPAKVHVRVDTDQPMSRLLGELGL
jgi:aminoglycoside phosphotransferase family enzyme/predicted kinase